MKKLITKAVAEVVESDDKDAPNGSFEAILSTPSLDRDGDELKTAEWKTPLPDHIVIDTDHTMSVAGTVGSATPFIDDDGNMRVKGTYASTAKGQEIRTLVNEGHIKTMSVTFLSEETKVAGGKTVTQRELLNGAFVAVPSNRDAKVLSSKAFAAISKAAAEEEPEVEEGSAKHDDMVQAIHDAAVHLGADCAAPEDVDKVDPADDDKKKKSFTAMVIKKGVEGSVEDLQSAISRAIDDGLPDHTWGYPVATFLTGKDSGTVVYRAWREQCGCDCACDHPRGSERCQTLSRSFSTDADGSVTLGDEVTEVELVTTTRVAEKKSAPTAQTKAAVQVEVPEGMTTEQFEAALAQIAATNPPAATDGGGKPDESPDDSEDSADGPAPDASASAAASQAASDDDSADETAPDDRARLMLAQASVNVLRADALDDNNSSQE